MKFKLVNNATGLQLGEHKAKHPLRYYGFSRDGELREDFEFQYVRVQAVIRQDGAIWFQPSRRHWDDGELYRLKREDWNIVFITPLSSAGLGLDNPDDAAERAAGSDPGT